jgi:hypothetical protein
MLNNRQRLSGVASMVTLLRRLGVLHQKSAYDTFITILKIVLDEK